jgi:hypothetical protein
LQMQMSNFSNTTKILMGSEMDQDAGLKVVEAQLENLESTFWRLLTAADKRIVVLIDALKSL